MEELRRLDGALRSGLLLSPRHGMPSPRRSLNTEFRAHFGFVALIIVCGACVVYLMQILRSILRPFLWALFLVMGLTPAVSLVERSFFCILALILRILRCLCSALCGCCRWVCAICACCCRQPHRRPSGGILGSPTAARPPRQGGRWEQPQPSILGQPRGGSDLAERDLLEHHAGMEEEDRDKKMWGPCTRFFVRALAVWVVVAGVVCVIGGFVLMVFQSAISLQGHWSVYKIGARNVVATVQHLVARITVSMSKEMTEEIAQNALLHAEDFLSAFVTEVLSNAWRFVLEFLMMALYIAFWLSDPMPVGSKMQELFRRYIILKGMACLGYGLCVGTLLHVLSVDLAEAFGLAAFLLSFVPEVGSIVAIMLPVPVILFDSRLESPSFTLMVATMAQLALKFVFANVVEVKLVEADQLMKMHPVIILLAVTFFGFIWGPTGMLLSVPLVSYVKVVLLSDQVPSCYRDPLLVVLEGDRSAPANYARRPKRRTSGRLSRGAAPEWVDTETFGGEVRRRVSESGEVSDAHGAAPSGATPAAGTDEGVAPAAAPGATSASSFAILGMEEAAASVAPQWPMSSANPTADIAGFGRCDREPTARVPDDLEGLQRAGWDAGGRGVRQASDLLADESDFSRGRREDPSFAGWME